MTQQIPVTQLVETTRPIMLLRWIDGTLHQAWEITRCGGGGGGGEFVSRVVEYRPVPTEDTP